jgi:hypothetical protein
LAKVRQKNITASGCAFLGSYKVPQIIETIPFALGLPKVTKTSTAHKAANFASVNKPWGRAIDTERKYRLLKVCYMPATSTAFLAFFFLFFCCCGHKQYWWDKQGRQYKPLISPSFSDVYGKSTIQFFETLVNIIHPVLMLLKWNRWKEAGTD